MNASGKRYITHPSKADVFSIYNLSDLHLGSAACAETKLAEDIEKIRLDPHAFWFGGGDYADYIGRKDRRFDPSSIAPWVSVKDLGQLGFVLIERVRDMLMPIRHKCLGLLFGNHEDSYAVEHEQQDRHGWLCTELGATNLAYSALVDIVFCRTRNAEPTLSLKNPVNRNDSSRNSFRFFLHHGAGGAVTPGGKLNRLIQFMDHFDADAYMIGHVHGQASQNLPSIGADSTCTTLVERHRIGVISGSYLKTYAQDITTWGERKAFRPATLGAACITIRPSGREIKATI